MHKNDLEKLTLASAARMIRVGELSPVELTRAVLDRVESLNDRMAMFITVTADHAMARAEAAERALKDKADLGALHGVPISLKDLFDTKGIRTTAGSRVFADRFPEENSTVTQRLDDAGAVLVGKTNLHEFAFGATSVNPHYGAVRNPWDPDRIAGGSSGGSAVSVALSAALGSMGSDTGGSIRIPAGLTGTVGLKPTYGRVSIAGVVPLSWSLDHVGPMTRTVEDAAIMLEAIAGHDPRDSYSRKVPVPAYSQELEGGIRGLRLGLPKTTFFDRLDPEIDSAVQTAIRRMEEMGASIVEVDIPKRPSAAADLREHCGSGSIFFSSAISRQQSGIVWSGHSGANGGGQAPAVGRFRPRAAGTVDCEERSPGGLRRGGPAGHPDPTDTRTVDRPESGRMGRRNRNCPCGPDQKHAPVQHRRPACHHGSLRVYVERFADRTTDCRQGFRRSDRPAGGPHLRAGCGLVRKTAQPLVIAGWLYPVRPRTPTLPQRAML